MENKPKKNHSPHYTGRFIFNLPAPQRADGTSNESGINLLVSARLIASPDKWLRINNVKINISPQNKIGILEQVTGEDPHHFSLPDNDAGF
jgi:hypothetical protein